MEKELVRLFKWIILALVVVLPIVTLSVMNRQNVRLNLDPFTGENPAIYIEWPFFVYLFIALFIGILIGGIGSWIRQGKWRKSARVRASEAREWRAKADRASRRLNATKTEQLPAVTMNP